MEALINVILRLAARQPTLLVVEDVHWSDASTLELLDLLLPRATAARLCVVITFRPEFQPPWADRAHVRRVSLARLTGSQTAALVALNSRGRGLPAAVVERLVQRAEGIPLFIEELTTVVADTWQSTARGAAPGFAPGFAADAIPGSLHELLLARLDALGGAGKEVAQVGAVLGREFRYELFQRVCLLDEGTFRRGLMQVVESGILRPEGLDSTTRYVFKHALLQEAAYQSLVKSARSELHRRAAAALAEHFPQEAEIHPELLAHHRAEAGDVSEAIAHWEKAGERATQRSALVEAIDHYRRAREALATLPGGPERDRRELALLLAMGSPLMSVHGYATPEVERLYARARELARATGAHADVFPAMQGLWQFYYVRGMLPVSRELGNELLEIAREAESSTFLLLAHRSIASSAFLQGDYEACRDHTQAGYQLYDVHVHGALALRTGHDPGVAHGVYLAWALWMLGYPDQALRWVNDMIELARRLAHPLSLAFALCYAALVRNYRGEHDEARSLADEALRSPCPTNSRCGPRGPRRSAGGASPAGRLRARDPPDEGGHRRVEEHRRARRPHVLLGRPRGRLLPRRASRGDGPVARGRHAHDREERRALLRARDVPPGGGAGRAGEPGGGPGALRPRPRARAPAQGQSVGAAPRDEPRPAARRPRRARAGGLELRARPRLVHRGRRHRRPARGRALA